jgi:hypothetical protein
MSETFRDVTRVDTSEESGVTVHLREFVCHVFTGFIEKHFGVEGENVRKLVTVSSHVCKAPMCDIPK